MSPIQQQPDLNTLGNAVVWPDLDTVVNAIITQESGGRADARGQKGEIGLAQIMPSTAAQYGIGPEALAHPEVNKMVAKRYLSDMLRKYNGNMNLALAAYNAGPGNVDKGNIPQSTHDYVSRVLAHAGGGGGGGGGAPLQSVSLGSRRPDESTLEIPRQDESTLEIPSVYRPGGAQPTAFAQNMLFRPGGMGQQVAGGTPPGAPAGISGLGGQSMVFPPRGMGQQRLAAGGPPPLPASLPAAAPPLPPAPPVLGSAGARPPSLQDILSTPGAESKYGPLGAQPFEALQAGDMFRPQEMRRTFAAVTGGEGGAEEEIPELSSSARAVVRRARDFGIDPQDIGPLAQKVREGTLTERGLKQALQMMRKTVPESARMAAAIRGAAEELPRDLLGEISKGVREGKLTLQQAKRMLKAAGVGGAALATVLGGREGTAQAAAYDPAIMPSGTETAAPPKPAAAPSNLVDIQAMTSSQRFRNGSAADQARWLKKAEAHNRVARGNRYQQVITPSTVTPEESEGYQPDRPRAGPPAPPFYDEELQQEDIRNPRFGKYWRRPATRGVERQIAKVSPDWAQFGAEAIVPQTPTDMAILLSQIPLGLGELGMGERIGLGGLDYMAATAPRRMLTTGMVGGLTSKATGGEFMPGFVQGTLAQGTGELTGGAGRILGRTVGKEGALAGTLEDVGGKLSNTLPEIGTVPKTPADFERVFTHEAGRENAGKILGAFRDKIQKKIGNMPFSVHYRDNQGNLIPLKGSFSDIEDRIERLNDVGWSATSGTERGAVSGRIARKEAHSLRDQLARQLDQKLPGQNLGSDYMTIRRQYGAIKDITRIFQQNKNIFTGRKGELNQPLLADLFGREYADDLVESLGRDKVQNILLALRGGAAGPAFADPSERVRLHFRHLLPGASEGRSYKPPGKLPLAGSGYSNPLLMNLPRAPWTATVGRPIGSLGQQLLWPEDQQQ